mgnify:CR=1 FL=1
MLHKKNIDINVFDSTIFKTSIDKKIFPSEIETSHLNSKPIINISKNIKDYKFIASLSHENEFAIAGILSVKN